MRTDNPMPYLEIRNVSKTYAGRKPYTALEQINLCIQQGEFVSLIGHSGCGKSTLLNILAGLEQASSGQVYLEEEPILEPGPDRAVVFQNYSLLPWMTVYENVSEALDASRPEMDGLMQRGRVEEFLRIVGLWKHRDKRPSELSGGMRQRVAIARALTIHPKILLLDEPFGALDALTRSELQDQINTLRNTPGAAETVVMVTHDIDEALYLSDTIVVMTNGPKARIQELVHVPFPKPRERAALLKHPGYEALKNHLVDLLTNVLRVKETH